MTLPLRISSKALALVLLAVNWASAQSTVKGSVILTDSSNGAVQRKRDYSSVAVWLEPAVRGVVPRPGRKRAVMLQKDKRFTPHILVVECGTNIDFPNQDPIFHNAFSNFDGQLFDIGLYPPGTSRSVRFDRPGIVRVFCNIHSAMSAIIVAVDSPYFTTTAADGSFVIRNVEAGSYTLHFFHERALAETLGHLTRPLKVTPDTLALDPVSISEAGYLPSVHKNKFGNNYPDGNPSTKYGIGNR
jgi:plastocyanin